MTDTDIADRLDRLTGTRRMDRVMQWMAGIAGTLVTLAIVGLIVTVIDLRSSTAVSNAELRGAIDRLSDRMEASSSMSGMSVSGLLHRLEDLEKVRDAHAARLRTLERDAVLRNDGRTEFEPAHVGPGPRPR